MKEKYRLIAIKKRKEKRLHPITEAKDFRRYIFDE